MRIETTRKQRWTFTIVSDLMLLAVAGVFHNLTILLGVLGGVTLIHGINWKLIDWGIEYRDLVPEVELGQVRDDDLWATYYYDERIVLHAPMKENDSNEQYAKTILGIDHEYLHHVLFKIEGEEASRKFDKLARTLTEHCLWVGFPDMIITVGTDNFWKSLA